MRMGMKGKKVSAEGSFEGMNVGRAAEIPLLLLLGVGWQLPSVFRPGQGVLHDGDVDFELAPLACVFPRQLPTSAAAPATATAILAWQLAQNAYGGDTMSFSHMPMGSWRSWPPLSSSSPRACSSFFSPYEALGTRP